MTQHEYDELMFQQRWTPQEMLDKGYYVDEPLTRERLPRHSDRIESGYGTIFLMPHWRVVPLTSTNTTTAAASSNAMRHAT